MAGFYTAVANYYPQHTFAQYNTAHDHAQEHYFVLAGGPADGFGSALQASLDEVSVQAPNFRSYIAPGTMHGIIVGSDFYRSETEGVCLRDWVAALANHQQAANVHCTECHMPFISSAQHGRRRSSAPESFH